MSPREIAKRAVISTLRRVPPRASAALPSTPLRARAVHLHAEVLRMHPVAYSRARTRFGFVMSGTTADLLQRNVYVFGAWEPNISRWTQRFVQPGDTVVDVGANVGYFSLLCAVRAGSAGRVIAFEPVPSIVEALRANLAANGISNVEVQPVIAADEPGEAEIFRGDAGNLGRSATAAGAGRVSEGTVRVVRAADAIDCEVWPEVRLVKVDTEGDDLRALRGLEPLLRAMRTGAAALVEVTPDELAERGESAEALVEFMRGAGFDRMLAIENSYALDAYISDRPQEPVPISDVPREKMDVVFLKS